ncbi:hypothetical protein IGI37_001437 [Enterococcus sp. AZ194]|uniref:CdaR family protein n=1 Tax=Enterococcus sp. AZ194 TaxID=2774629 RepID=UPI003F273491
MDTKNKRSNILYAVLALLFSLLLFLNANGKSMNTTSAVGSEDYSETATNVVIKPIYDSEKYYIHGFEKNVTVKLSSANKVQLNAELNEDTRNFSVVADLSKLKPGTHEVRLRMQNLSSAVSASIDPGTVTVTIEKKVTKTFDVEPVVSSSNTGDGFTLGDVAVSPKEVQITTGEQTLNEISRVVATVDPTKVAKADFSEKVAIQALNKAGEPLSILSTPDKVTVDVEVVAPHKVVTLYPQQTGNQEEGIAYYSLTLNQTLATISGAQEKLDSLSSVGVPIDVTGITKKVKKAINVPIDSGLAIAPQTVEVTIVPIYEAGYTQRSVEPNEKSSSESTSSSFTNKEKTTSETKEKETSATKATSAQNEQTDETN